MQALGSSWMLWLALAAGAVALAGLWWLRPTAGARPGDGAWPETRGPGVDLDLDLELPAAPAANGGWEETRPAAHPPSVPETPPLRPAQRRRRGGGHPRQPERHFEETGSPGL